MKTPEERLRAGCVVQPDGCWRWTRSTVSGYSHISVDGKLWLGHRLSYHLFVGPIPAGMTVDHLCFNSLCVNPEHLRLLTHAENCANQRSAFKTHCVNGHEFTPENTRIKPPGRRQGVRDCRKCNSAAVARYKAKRKAS